MQVSTQKIPKIYRKTIDLSFYPSVLKSKRKKENNGRKYLDVIGIKWNCKVILFLQRLKYQMVKSNAEKENVSSKHIACV